jgi:hypothetical protein
MSTLLDVVGRKASLFVGVEGDTFAVIEVVILAASGSAIISGGIVWDGVVTTGFGLATFPDNCAVFFRFAGGCNGSSPVSSPGLISMCRGGGLRIVAVALVREGRGLHLLGSATNRGGDDVEVDVSILGSCGVE